MKIVLISLWGILNAQSHTVDYDYNAAGNMIQRTVIILSPMMADTTENDHSHPDPDIGQTAQVAESTTEATTHTGVAVTSRSSRYSFNLYPNPTHGNHQKTMRS